MTRTDPPNVTTSTLYQYISPGLHFRPSTYSVSPKECGFQMVGTLNQNFETINKRHCRSFDFNEPWDKPENTISLSRNSPFQMETKKDVAWCGSRQQGHLRFSSPDLFNIRLSQKQPNMSNTRESAKTGGQDKTKSKKAHNGRATVSPLPFPISQPSVNSRQYSVNPNKRLDVLSQNQGTSQFLANDVHPIKLQPHVPLCVSDNSEDKEQDKLVSSSHVRCRVDIKPDASVLQHTRKLAIARGDFSWQHHSPTGFSSFSMPHEKPISRTLVSDSMNYRQIHNYPHGVPCDYIQPLHTSLGRISAKDRVEYRSQSNPNIPTKFYTDSPYTYPVQTLGGAYYQHDQYSNNINNQNPYLSGQYVHNPRLRWSHTMPVPTYTEESEETYAFPSDSSRIFCTQPSHSSSEYTSPQRAYCREGHHSPCVSRVFPGNSVRSSIATYSSQYPSSQVTPLKVLPVYPSSDYVESDRLGGTLRSYSKSWDNILMPHMTEIPAQRGTSYKNLHYQEERGLSSNNKPTAISDLTGRQYVALSLSENCLEKCAKDRTHGVGHYWFATPEITITNNDIYVGDSKKREGDSENCYVTNGRQNTFDIQNKVTHADPPKSSVRAHNNCSLQDSLEQLDKLLSDLVTDHKPQNSTQRRADLIDQLKHLINNDDVKKKVIHQHDSGLANTLNSDARKNPAAYQRSVEDDSLNHSPDDYDDVVCSNRECQRRETLFNASLYFKSCHSCYTYYCSRSCRRKDWDIHKGNCLYGRISSVCRHILKHCRENYEVHKAFSHIAKVGYLSRGRGVLVIGFPSPGSVDNFFQVGLKSLLVSPSYLSLRELDRYRDKLGEYFKELLNVGKEYDPNECFLLNVSITVGGLATNRPSPRLQTPTVRKFAKVSLASTSPDTKVLQKEGDMGVLILTPPAGTCDIDKDGQEGRKAREICFINIQKELCARGVFLRHEFPAIYSQLCGFVESNKRFTPTTIYPVDKRTGKQFMCMIMAPHLLDDII